MVTGEQAQVDGNGSIVGRGEIAAGGLRRGLNHQRGACISTVDRIVDGAADDVGSSGNGFLRQIIVSEIHAISVCVNAPLKIARSAIEPLNH
jgi:hypothetical protein